jgi:hypothetical protein
MKIIIKCLLITVALFSCENSENPIIQETENSLFENYTYQSKEIIHNDVGNYKTETIFIGTTLVDSIEYKVLTEFRKIQAANSIRGRSTLILVDKITKDSICYDVEMPRNLPIDIYNNYFVFKRNEDSTFVFTEIDVKDVICFGEFGCYQKTKYYK